MNYSVCVQGLRFEVVPSWFKETLDKALFKTPYEYAVETAKQKALEVARRMPLVRLVFLFSNNFFQFRDASCCLGV